MSKEKGRKIVRDPRKQRVPSIRPSLPTEVQDSPQNVPQQRQPLAFEPSAENQQSVGSSLGSYMLAGAGMAIGFSIVGAIFGGF
jgi:hypothetical protein